MTTSAPGALHLKLSAAELCVLLTAISVDPQPFIDGSDLISLNRTHLFQRLSAAREGLLLRKLAKVQPDDSLAVADPTRDLLLKSAQPKAGFQLFHARAGAIPQRILFSVTNTGTVMHRIKGIVEHLIQPLPLADPSAIVEAVLKLSAPPAPASRATPKTYSVPHQVMAALAGTPPKPNPELLPLLTGAGLSATDAEALLSAGTQPTQQTVFTAIAARGGQIGSGGAMWFADAKSAWLFSDFNQGGQVTVQRATNAAVREAINALITEALGSPGR
ncbi:MAG TPA: hypothetical protein VJ020_05755 [Anaerolineales bacterium]|nr:hypothetical protein [Anaerolineales bacterium]